MYIHIYTRPQAVTDGVDDMPAHTAIGTDGEDKFQRNLQADLRIKMREWLLSSPVCVSVYVHTYVCMYVYDDI